MRENSNRETFLCEACGTSLKIDRSLAGRRVACRCGHHFRVPTSIQHPRGVDKVAASAPDVSEDDVARVQAVREAYLSLRDQLSQVVLGQQSVIEQALIAMLCRGHVLLTGVPGLAKTLLVSSISGVLDLSYKRVQFTPDLMPSDITGTEVLQEDRSSGLKQFQFVEGPIFCNLVLADEINRSPPKTQAALLEAMQERHVTIGDTTHVLPAPFFVMATQNPIEQEGTYPLPEAQLDRFLFNILVDYPQPADELAVIKLATSDWQPQLTPVLDAAQILSLQQTVRRVPAADHVIEYARDLVQATRPKYSDAPSFIREWVSWGAGPRAGISLVMAAKARAVLYGRYHATTADIKQVAPAVLRHRLVTTFNADAAGIRRDDIIQKLLEYVQPPQNARQTPRAGANGKSRFTTIPSR
ncbi:MAG TPA: MoxR family ATPase [Pirellulaceae bacterium]|nr:MoxR family ATPase [Pirellulaceae bacterium]